MTDFDALKQQILEKYLATGVTALMTDAVLIDWKTIGGLKPVYQVQVTFTRNRTELKVPYHRGTGLFEKDDIYVSPLELLNTLPKTIARKYFKPEIIFACVCSEAQTAMDLIVEDYCTQLYENSDSHKGHLAHANAIRNYQLLNYMSVKQETIKEFTELHDAL